ncbi:hypothetical protein N658DRAFT_476671 [Parathielavia hyrcaniae]|uniref:Uncharacterized protein n=1 Tax=Parathielavia hyrcaniae TaxID=113614 RepID=A0AAN6PVT5_9PEZI|nr:hypothetical protein N658DRAFT_476671 [Parathielavia hyrcaniae]
MCSQKESLKTYNTGYSLVVTDPTTSPAVGSLSRGERTGSRVFYRVWSYVIEIEPGLSLCARLEGRASPLHSPSSSRNSKLPSV